jgi:hypothetical protein
VVHEHNDAWNLAEGVGATLPAWRTALFGAAQTPARWAYRCATPAPGNAQRWVSKVATPARTSRCRWLATTAIALAPLSAVATTPVVAQADSWAGGLGTEHKGNHWGLFLPAQHRISTEPALPEPAPTSSAAPLQTPQAVPPSLLPPSTLPETDAYKEPTEPWWPLVVRYGVLLLAVGLIAWRVGLACTQDTERSATLSLQQPRTGR